MKRIMTTAAGIALAAVWCVASSAAEPPPYGHKDFYPSDERPIGFRADGNGAFPGATPVTSFREGDVAQVEMKIALCGDAGGNQIGAFRQQRVPVFTNNNRVNIVWKTEMPGFSNSSPIVVGDRVLCMADPYVLVCTDINTGKILWQRDINPLALMNLPTEQVDRYTHLMEICWVVHSIEQGLFANYGRLSEKTFTEAFRTSLKERYELIRKVAQKAVELDKEKAFGAETLMTKTEQALKAIAEEKVTVAGEAFDSKALVRKLGHRGCSSGLYDCIEGPMRQRFGFYVKDHWAGLVNHDFPTPVSDGKRVYVSIGQGQVACVDLNGNLVWGRHFPMSSKFKWRDFNRCCHCVSPLLIGNVVVAQQFEALIGLDKMTGKTIWENPDVRVGGWTFMGTYKHMRLRNGGKVADVIVPPRDTIVDAATGKVVCTLPGEKVKKETTIPVMGTPDGYVCVTFYGDTVILKLQLTNEGVVKAEQVCQMGEQYRWRDAGRALILQDRRLISTVASAGVYELLTGKPLYQFSKRNVHDGVGPILAGKFVVGFGDDCNGGDFRSREDECLMASFPVVDVSDATKPKILGSGLLGGFNKPHVRHLEKWVPELNNKGWMPMVSRPAKAMWEMAAVPPSWSASCPAAQGNRVFIRSHSHLYCIGDPNVPYDWNPASRPKEVTETLTKAVEQGARQWALSSTEKCGGGMRMLARAGEDARQRGSPEMRPYETSTSRWAATCRVSTLLVRWN